MYSTPPSQDPARPSGRDIIFRVQVSTAVTEQQLHDDFVPILCSPLQRLLTITILRLNISTFLE